jgi:hypothetical protein
MSSVSGIDTSSSSVYNDSSTSSNASSGTSASTGYALPTQDSLELQNASSLIQTMYPQSASASVASISYPTNIQQAAQSQAILKNNPNLAQLLSQQSSSPLLATLAAPLEVLQATGNSTGIDSSQTESIVSSMAVLQEVQSSGTLKSNPSVAQSLLQYSNPSLDLSPLGSLVNTTA